MEDTDTEHDPGTEMIALTQCCYCEQVIPLVLAVVSTFRITETWTEQEHSCSNKCAKAWWESFHARD